MQVKLTNFADIPTLLTKYLKDSIYIDEVKSKMKNFSRKHFENEIGPLIESMFTL